MLANIRAERILKSMPAKYKVLIMDADGTSVAADRDAEPTSRVIEAVQKAQARLHVALGTGRTFQSCQLIINALGLKGPSVLTGGAEIVDVSTGKVLHAQLLSVEALREVAEIALRFHDDILTAGLEHGAAINSPNDIQHPAAMLVVNGVDDEKVGNIIEEVEAVNGVVAHKANSWHGEHLADLHITHEQATKRHGVEHLIKLLGISQEEVIAIGDSHNDLPLLQAAGFKVAMGDAPKELQEAADYVAPPFRDDGVADVIERFILAGR
jgi:5-amino-6-(5-phospho-D-ribitylamino)uracil phosphatase